MARDPEQALAAARSRYEANDLRGSLARLNGVRRLYAKRGEIVLVTMDRGSQRGLIIVARDEGEGIPDIRQALQDGYSTSGRRGYGSARS